MAAKKSPSAPRNGRTGFEDCPCHAAVVRAHAGMIASGAPDSVALEAAVRVYRYHHPEVAPGRAHDQVERWVFTGPLH